MDDNYAALKLLFQELPYISQVINLQSDY
jgi:ankyrin repeat protein